jgi:hypothetical protein
VSCLATCALAATLFRASGIRTYDEAALEAADVQHGRAFYFLVAVFFLAAAAGLMVLSQAAAIVQSYGGVTSFAVAATTFITGAVGAARIAGGGSSITSRPRASAWGRTCAHWPAR